MRTDDQLAPRDAARLKRIADAFPDVGWEMVLHAPHSCGITPDVIALLEQVMDADGSVTMRHGGAFHCEVGGHKVTVRCGPVPAFESTTDTFPSDPPHLRALADLPVQGYQRRVERWGNSLTATVGVSCDGSGSELAHVIQAGQDVAIALEAAPSMPGAGYDDLVARFVSKGLGVPHLPSELAEKLTVRGPWWWASDIGPKPFEDYLLETVPDVEGPIHDHVAVSHAGHGLNSYALTWRQAYGPLAFVVQSAWGGGLSDEPADIGRQAELFARCSDLVRTLEAQHTVPDSPFRIRRLVLSVSDIRSVLSLRRWNGALTELEPVALDEHEPWEDIVRHVKEAEEVT